MFSEQAAQIDAMHRALDEGRLMTATWSAEEQGKLAARIVAEVQGSRRMILDRSATASAAQRDAMQELARDIAAIRETLGAHADTSLYAVLDSVLVSGATVVHVGAVAGRFIEHAMRKVGASGQVCVLGPESELDALFAEAVVDVLRIDAAGHEPAVLRGARRSLARHASVLIMARFDRSALRAAGLSPDSWLAAFAAIGFTTETSADSLEEVESCELIFSHPRH